MEPSHFTPWIRTRHSRNVELDQLHVISGRLAIRDVYDRDSPAVVLAVPPGDHRVWSTEFNIRSTLKTGDPLYRPAYLSVQVSDTPPATVGSPGSLYDRNSPSNRTDVYTDLGIVLIHDADSIALQDMESLDESWEQAWESPNDYSEVRSAAGARIVTCKTVFERTRFPILATYDAADQPVAIHIDFGVIDTTGTAKQASDPLLTWSRKMGAITGRTFPWVFRRHE